MRDAVVQQIREAVRADLSTITPAVLAVSGGVDSMVLLDAAQAALPAASLRVATFNHATGEHADRAVDLVEEVALNAGISLVVGRSEPIGRPSEDAWRNARLSFLRSVVAEHRGALCLAHTRDDQVETVLFRAMRDAGARGLAGLRASSKTRRPLLPFSRSEIARYAKATSIRWVDDPTNSDRSFARNRLRLDLLPAIREVRPDFEAEVLALGERAASWRDELDAAVDSLIDFDVDDEPPGLEIAVASLQRYDVEQLSIIWPALLGRIGVVADWRGTRRLSEFTRSGSAGRRIPLSGGWVVHRRRQTFEVRRGE